MSITPDWAITATAIMTPAISRLYKSGFCAFSRADGQ